jgi:ATP-dependent Clp protease ATP-binding subunit ClpA
VEIIDIELQKVKRRLQEKNLVMDMSDPPLDREKIRGWLAKHNHSGVNIEDMPLERKLAIKWLQDKRVNPRTDDFPLELHPAKAFLIGKGSSLEFGARPLRRAIEHLLEDPLAEVLLQGAFEGKGTIVVRVTEVDGEKKLTFEATGTTQTPELATAIKAGG